MTSEIQTVRDLLESVKTGPTEDDLEQLHEFLDGDDQSIRRQSLDAIRVAAQRDPDLVREEFGEELEPLRSALDDESSVVRTAAVGALGPLYADDPEAIEPVLDQFETILEDDHRIVQDTALEVLRGVALADPEAPAPLVDVVRPFLERDEVTAYTHAAVFLGAVSEVDPEGVAESVPELFELFEEGEGFDGQTTPSRRHTSESQEDRFRKIEKDRFSRDRLVRQASGRAIAQVAFEHPDVVAPLADDLVDLLEDDDPMVRTGAAQVFVGLANGRPDVVEPHRRTLGDRLEAEDSETVVGLLSQVLSTLGVEYPREVGEVAADLGTDLHALLDDENAEVRGAAAALLAFSESAEVIEPAADRLEALADGDEPEYVTAAAADALSVLE